jgi:prepilin-type N-terminal cleavage/methylation domain-containing protein
MRINLKNQTQRHRAGLTLVEVVIALSIAGIVAVSLYAGLARSFNAVQSARHRLRATQILTEKLDVIRLYNWTQITNGFIPQSFTEYYEPVADTNAWGIVYTGSIAITNAPVHSAYTNTMRKAVVRVNWVSGGIAQEDRMETLISQYGIHKYIY